MEVWGGLIPQRLELSRIFQSSRNRSQKEICTFNKCTNDSLGKKNCTKKTKAYQQRCLFSFSAGSLSTKRLCSYGRVKLCQLNITIAHVQVCVCVFTKTQKHCHYRKCCCLFAGREVLAESRFGPAENQGDRRPQSEASQIGVRKPAQNLSLSCTRFGFSLVLLFVTFPQNKESATGFVAIGLIYTPPSDSQCLL